jgi:UV DNA damage repair endonuclease
MSQVKVVGLSISNSVHDAQSLRNQRLEKNRHLYGDLTTEQFFMQLHPEQYTYFESLLREVEYRSMEVMKRAMIDGVAIMYLNGRTLTVTMQENLLYMLDGTYINQVGEGDLLKSIKEHIYCILQFSVIGAMVE